MNKPKIKRSIGQVLANRNTEIAEIIIKMFSFRLLLLLTLPLFNDYLVRMSDDEVSGTPYVTIAVVVVALGTWLYGFLFDKLRWRKWGMGLSMFLHTFITIGILVNNPGNGTWSIYLILAIASTFVYTRLKQAGWLNE